MGLFDSVGKIFSKVTDFASKVMENPIVKMGLSAVTGGWSNLVGAGLSAINSLKSGAGSISDMFSGFASKFLGGSAGGLAGGALSMVQGFLDKAKDTGDVKNMAADWMKAIRGETGEQSAAATGESAAAGGTDKEKEAEQMKKFWEDTLLNNIKQMVAKSYERLKESRPT